MCLPLFCFLGCSNCVANGVISLSLADLRTGVTNVAVVPIDKVGEGGGIAGVSVHGGSTRIRKSSVSIDLINILRTTTRGIGFNFVSILGDVFPIFLKNILALEVSFLESHLGGDLVAMTVTAVPAVAMAAMAVRV